MNANGAFDVRSSVETASWPSHARHITGLPQEVSKQLRVTGATSTLAGAVERAKLLMTNEHHGEAAAIATK